MDTSEVFSVVASAFSIALAVIAIRLALTAASESRDNYQKTKDALAEIDKTSALIHQNVAKHQSVLSQMIQHLLPKQPDPDDESFRADLRLVARDPEELARLLSLGASSGRQPDSQSE